MSDVIQFPPQQLPFSRKTVSWRKKHCDWADSKTFFNDSLVRNSVIHKKINYDLIGGKIHMNDMLSVVNPEGTLASYIPENIQHYPIMNSKLNVLRGEESKRVFDYKVVVTNPNSISEIEDTKKQQLFSQLQNMIQDTSQSEDEFSARLEKLSKYYAYEWQDLREVRANALLNHYWKEYDMPLMFNKGFVDAMTVGEEIYMCDIVNGEPIVEKLDPSKVRVFKSGYSDRIEDADIIVIEDYWSPGKIIDTFYDVLTPKDMKYIESISSHEEGDFGDDDDPRYEFIASDLFEDGVGDVFESVDNSYMPYDTNGNIKVVKIFWKSRRKIKKIKSYNQDTGEEEFNFYPETYVPNKDLGEEEEVLYINQAWEGTKIGKCVYVNMRPRIVQYNRLSNPSRCHFGIVGAIYNINGKAPFSLVDMMKPYNYLYDATHDRLNRMMAENWGKLAQIDIAKVPTGWDLDKWMYFAKVHKMAIWDSFREGNSGAGQGKLAGGLNNNSTGAIDLELGNSIQHNINLLEFIKSEMSEVAGISRQREGQISNRETVGGVERATLQSSHITEWLFMVHDDVKRRVLECFLETAKIALKGKNIKFQYILPGVAAQIVDIDGDEFADNDYGLAVDNSNSLQELRQKIDMLAQAALQNQTLNFSTIMKLYNSSSLAEKQRMVEENERELMERQQQAQQQQMEAQQQQLQQQLQMKEYEMQLTDTLNQRDNDTKIVIAAMSKSDNAENKSEEYSQESKDKLLENMRQFNERLNLDKERLDFEKQKAKTDADLKRAALNKKQTSNK